MYTPKFSHSDDINENLMQIESLKKSILGSSINPKIDINLKKKALSKMVYASISLNDDDSLPFACVDRLINGLNREATDKKEKKADNYFKVLKAIDKYHINGKVSEKLILKMHEKITKNLFSNSYDEGHYRTTNNHVADHNGGIRYYPPDVSHVPGLMKYLIKWINEDSNKLSPILAAGIVHYELVRIHPFVNGNGRTARALATLILCFRSFDIKGYFALDEYYNEDKLAYVNALKSADDSNDLTQWLEYFTEGFLISVSEVNKMILGLPNIGNEPIDLTERQIEVLKYITEEGMITTQKTRELFGLSPQASQKILKDLVEMGIINMVNKGPSTYYQLN